MTTPLERILAKLPDAKKSGTGWSACCPAHDDRQPSLSIAEGEDGRVLLKCHAGCSVDAICAAIGLKPTDLYCSTSTVLPADRGNRIPWTARRTASRRSSRPTIIATKRASCCSRSCASTRRIFGSGAQSPAAAGSGRSKACVWFRIACRNCWLGPTSRCSWSKAKRMSTTWPASACWRPAMQAAPESGPPNTLHFCADGVSIATRDNDDSGRSHVEQVARLAARHCRMGADRRTARPACQGRRERLDRGRRHEGRN